MARKRKGCCGCLVGIAALLGLAGAGLAVFATSLAPMPARPAEFVRFSKTTSMEAALGDLEKRKVVRNSSTALLFARFKRKAHDLSVGTYRVKAGSTVEQLLVSLARPYSQMVRVPEGWWIARTGKRLEDNGVCLADDYVKAATDPKVYKDVGLDLSGSLEGYLFPDTYDLPPLTPPEDIVRTQLETFKKKVLSNWPKDKNLKRAVIVASMVELEAAKDSERPRIAGVIENRLRKGMPLEIDATVLYALQKWQALKPGVVRTVDSPYNTYLHRGLPPGPIGSPGLKSILAAIHPEAHGYLYYVARPDRSHYFSTTYPDHLKNIRKARAEWKAAESR